MSRKLIDNPNSCTLVHAMNLLGSKWKPIIIYLLSSGPLRFGKLNVLLPTISRKVLTDQLKELTQDGLISRQAFAEIPPRVEYSLTERAEGLLSVLRQLSDWVNEEFQELDFEECRITLPNSLTEE